MVVFLKLWLLIYNFDLLMGATALLNEKNVSSVVEDGDDCLFHEALGLLCISDA